MKKSTSYFLVLIPIIVLLISFFLFSWQLLGQINLKLPIDAIRYANFGSFVGGIFGTLSIIFIIFTYRNSQEQSGNNSFFNLLQIHESIVRELRSRDNEITKLFEESKQLFEPDLCENAKELQSECNSYKKMEKANDYFEMLYRILHIRYKYNKDEDAAASFFHQYNWRIGHFLNSFISIMEFIDKGKFDKSQKDFFIRIFTTRSTWDEKRLVFYFVISFKTDLTKDWEQDKETRYRYAKMLDTLNICWNAPSIPLIKGDVDLNKFKNILKSHKMAKI